MQRRTRLASVWAAAGLVLTALSILAPAVGLDQGAGWGRGRVGVLVVGAALLGWAAVFHWYGAQVRAMMRRLKAQVDRIPLIARMGRNARVGAAARWLAGNWQTLAIGMLVLLFYLWFASGGTWTRLASSSHHYSSLAAAFERGQLHLLEGPEAGQRAPRDVSLYDGKYYLYWGPVPALLLLPLRLLGVGLVPDSYLALGFIAGTFIVQGALLATIWSRYFAGLPRWILNMALMVAGLAGPALFLRHNYESAKVYEAAINGGQFFLTAGLLAILPGLAGKRPSMWRMTLAGAMWALALGTRLTLAAPVGVMTVLVVIGRLRRDHRSLVEAAARAWMLIPLILGVAGLGWYNWARFGTVAESGLSYALSSTDMQRHPGELFDVRYVIPNLYNYLIRPPGAAQDFPFVRMRHGAGEGFFAPLPVPALYHPQPVVGLLAISPFVLFSLAPVLARRFRFNASHRKEELPAREQLTGLGLLKALLWGSALSALAVVVLYFWVAARFLQDFLPSISLLAAIGFWQVYESAHANPPRRRALGVLGWTLASVSVAASTLLAFSTYAAMFR